MTNPPRAAGAAGFRRTRSPLVAATALLALLAAVLAACRSGGAEAPLTASGTLEADETLIAAQVTGVITALPLAEGADVLPGMLVAKIDDRMVDQQIQVVGVEQAQVLRVQKQNYTLLSPITGIVLRIPVRVGELAAPGRVLVTVGRLDRLKMTIYVREADLGRVAVGQRLTITADPFPGQSFEGTVTSINQRAEFTPRNVQTRTDRLNLVFGVQATVDNPDGALKPGMPVDARFEPEAAP